MKRSPSYQFSNLNGLDSNFLNAIFLLCFSLIIINFWSKLALISFPSLESVVELWLNLPFHALSLLTYECFYIQIMVSYIYKSNLLKFIYIIFRELSLSIKREWKHNLISDSIPMTLVNRTMVNRRGWNTFVSLSDPWKGNCCDEATN